MRCLKMVTQLPSFNSNKLHIVSQVIQDPKISGKQRDEIGTLPLDKKSLEKNEEGPNRAMWLIP